MSSARFKHSRPIGLWLGFILIKDAYLLYFIAVKENFIHSTWFIRITGASDMKPLVLNLKSFGHNAIRMDMAEKDVTQRAECFFTQPRAQAGCNLPAILLIICSEFRLFGSTFSAWFGFRSNRSAGSFLIKDIGRAWLPSFAIPMRERGLSKQEDIADRKPFRKILLNTVQHVKIFRDHVMVAAHIGDLELWVRVQKLSQVHRCFTIKPCTVRIRFHVSAAVHEIAIDDDLIKPSTPCFLEKLRPGKQIPAVIPCQVKVGEHCHTRMLKRLLPHGDAIMILQNPIVRKWSVQHGAYLPQSCDNFMTMPYQKGRFLFTLPSQPVARLA